MSDVAANLFSTTTRKSTLKERKKNAELRELQEREPISFVIKKQGRRHNFKSGGQKRAENFWGLYPHICHSGGYNRYKERHSESLSDSVAILYLTGCARAILASI